MEKFGQKNKQMKRSFGQIWLDWNIKRDLGVGFKEGWALILN
jgi:hypothetical protein